MAFPSMITGWVSCGVMECIKVLGELVDMVGASLVARRLVYSYVRQRLMAAKIQQHYGTERPASSSYNAHCQVQR